MGVLMMLMTIGGLAVAAVLLAVSYFGKVKWLRKFTLGGVAVWFAMYAASLIGFSLVSQERTLSVGEPKQFCGFYLDCHMHAVVTGVRTAKQLGNLSANGTFWIVNLKVFSDARNPKIAFRLLQPRAIALDDTGNKLSLIHI